MAFPVLLFPSETTVDRIVFGDHAEFLTRARGRFSNPGCIFRYFDENNITNETYNADPWQIATVLNAIGDLLDIVYAHNGCASVGIAIDQLRLSGGQQYQYSQHSRSTVSLLFLLNRCLLVLEYTFPLLGVSLLTIRVYARIRVKISRDQQ